MSENKYCDVCGIPFEVKEVESNSRDDAAMGRCDGKLCVITINKEMPEKMKETVLIHEWVHGVLECSGLGEFSSNETLVCSLQNELYRAGFRVKTV